MSAGTPGPVPDKRPAYEPAARLLTPPGYDPRMPRPAATVAGAVLVLLGVVAQAIVYWGLATGWQDLVGDVVGMEIGPDAAQAALWLVLGIGGLGLVIEIVLALLIYRGHNWPRVLVMVISVFSIGTSFTAWWAQGQEITIQGTFVSLSLDILLLLALSSRSAARYARRTERR